MAEKGLGKGLGAGLGALFGEEQVKKEAEGLSMLPISKVEPRADQPRRIFDEVALEELSESIRKHGLLQPLTARRLPDGYYQIIAGERRWRAARMAGLTTVPVHVIEADDRQAMEMALVENLQREDLNPIEEAMALEEMIKTYGLTQDEVSKSVGKSRPYITNALRLLKLPQEVRDMVSAGQLSGGHARAIAGLGSDADKIAAAKKAVELGWSVREIENYTGKANKKKDPKKKAQARKKRDDVAAVEAQMKEALGTKVKIQYGPRKGKIEIEYYSKDELDRLVEMIISLRP